MSPQQIEALYLVKRDQYGNPSFPVPVGRLANPRELHRYRCWRRGIRDPEIVEDLWRAEQEKAKARAKERPKKKPRPKQKEA